MSREIFTDKDLSMLNKRLGGAAESRNLLNVRRFPFLAPEREPRNESMNSSLNPSREPITWRGSMKKSERLVVAKKRGNARGAKGPYFSHVTNNIRSSA